jgi:hypothetical protein
MNDVDKSALAGEPVRMRWTCSVRFIMKLLLPVGRTKAKRKVCPRASRAAATSAR